RKLRKTIHPGQGIRITSFLMINSIGNRRAILQVSLQRDNGTFIIESMDTRHYISYAKRARYRHGSLRPMYFSGPANTYRTMGAAQSVLCGGSSTRFPQGCSA